jgi:hypothetical protein
MSASTAHVFDDRRALRYTLPVVRCQLYVTA